MTHARRVSMILSVLGALLVGGCEQDPRGRKVSLSATAGGLEREAADARAAPVRIAIAPVISPRQNVGLYRPLLEYVAGELGRPVEMLQRRTYAEVNDLIRYGHAEVAFVCDYAFVEGERDFGMEILVVPEVMGQQTYQSFIIVPTESQAVSLADLRGKSFAFYDPLSSSGYLFPSHLLRQIGQSPETFFRRTVFTYSHDNTMKAVSQRRVDGGAIDSLVYQFMLRREPSYQGKTKVIQESEPWGNPPVVVHPDIDPSLREKLKEIFLAIHQSPRGRNVLAPLMIDRFFLPDHAAYDPVRQMAEEAARHLAGTSQPAGAEQMPGP